jgi:hypothetical protein
VLERLHAGKMFDLVVAQRKPPVCGSLMFLLRAMVILSPPSCLVDHGVQIHVKGSII